MRTLRGFAVGFLTLTFLEVYLTSANATAATGSLAATVASVIQRALSPAVAAIPNRASYNPSSSSGADPFGILKNLATGPTVGGVPLAVLPLSSTVQTSPSAPQPPAQPAVVNA